MLMFIYLAWLTGVVHEDRGNKQANSSKPIIDVKVIVFWRA